MANPINFPLSGAVTQSINPWDFWIKSFSSQMGFINIRNVTSSDYRIEQEVVENVASYGKQPGKINDVLMTIIDNPGLKNLDQGQAQSIDDFRETVSEIEQVKKKWSSPTSLLSAGDTVVRELKALKSDDP